MTAIDKRLRLLAEWQDKGFREGVERGQSGMSELRKRALQVAKAMIAATAAIVGITAALIKMIQKGSQVKSVEESFEGFRRSADMAPDTLERIRLAVRGTISDLDLMNASVRGLSMGLDPGRIVEFWEKSKQIADVSSQDTLMVFENLVAGYTKLEVETLKTIGITIRAEDVYKEYAAAIGKTQASLTTYDRQVAFSLALEKKYVENYQSVGDVTTRVREKFQQLAARVSNVKDKFFLMVAESPRVKAFLDMLIGGADGASSRLDELEPKIQSTTDAFIELIDKGQRTAKMLYNFRSVIYAIAGGFAAAKISTWIIGIVAALKTVGPAAISAGGWIGLAIGGIILLANNYKTVINVVLEGFKSFTFYFWELVKKILQGIQFLAEKIPFIGEKIGGGLDGAVEWLEGQQQRVLGMYGGWQEAVDKWPQFNIWDLVFPKEKQEPSGVEDEKRKIGGLWERPLEEPTPIRGEEKGSLPAPNYEEDLMANEDYWATRYDTALRYTAIMIDLEAGRHSSYLDFWHKEQFETSKNLRDRIEAYRSGFSAMGEYSGKFFKKGANMGRVLNAMMIRGFTEMAASYIESKTQQAKFDAMEFAYQALAAAARHDWKAAGQFAAAATKARLIAGAGALAAGFIRSYGEERAAALTAEQEEQWEAATGGEGERMTRQRKEASGVVNTRPIHIIVNSVANFNSGYMIFGDSEAAVNDLYEDHFRNRIEMDIESGAIAAA